MIVFSLQADSRNSKILVAKEDNAAIFSEKLKSNTLDLFVSKGDKKSDRWSPPELRWFDDDGRNLNKYRDPDVTYFGSSATLICNEKTMLLIKPVVTDVAELLPLQCNNETWYFINVFNQIDAIDKKSSKYKIYRTGEVGYLLKPAFVTSKLPHAKLFKIPDDPAMIYYAENHPDNDPYTFKNIVECNKLFGIKFEKVWEE